MNKRTDTKTLWKLFLSTLYISTFTFGGGFVIVTFMKQNLLMNCIGWKRMKCLILRLWLSPVRALLRSMLRF